MAHRRGGFAKKITTVHWEGVSFEAAGLTAGTVGQLVAAAQHLPETLMRIRGEVAACFSGSLAPTVGVALSMGIIQVPEGTGTTVLWSPFTDADAPWIWWDAFNLLYFEQVTDVIASQAAMSARRVMDSKAMRKLRNTELQFVAENVTITGFAAGAINVAGCARILAGT